MPDEELTNENEPVTPAVETRSDNRFKDLADKVKTASEERDAAKAEAEANKKEVEFYKGFSKVSSKYEGAADYQDKILEKVNSGYDLEDATISVLAKAGKLTNAPVTRKESPTGGSATTTMNQGGEKTLSEMTHAEKREALLQAEAENGGITKILRRGL